MKDNSKKIDLDQFEHQISPTILEKGLTIQSQVETEMIDETEKGIFKFLFKGKTPVSTWLKLTTTQMTEWGCTCEYTKGPVCMHVASLLMTVIEEGESFEKPAKQKKKKTESRKKTPGSQIKEILSKLSKQELDTYLIQLMDEEPKLRMKFISQLGSMANVSEREKMENHFGAILTSIQKKKEGLDRKVQKKLIEELSLYEFQIGSLAEKKEDSAALDLVIALFEILSPVLRFTKNNDLELHYGIIRLLDKVEESFFRIESASKREEVFETLHSIASSELKIDPLFKVSILLFLAKNVRSNHEKEKVAGLFDLLDIFSRQAGIDLHVKRREFILVHFGREAFLKYCMENKNKKGNLEGAIEYIINEKEYEYAEKLALEGQQQYGGYYYHTSPFALLLLKIYRLNNDAHKGVPFAKNLLILSGGELNYFEALKSMVDEKSWPAIRAKVILDLKKSIGSSTIQNLKIIFRSEGMWPEFLEQLKKNVIFSELISTTPDLFHALPKETMHTWFKALQRALENSLYYFNNDRLIHVFTSLKESVPQQEFQELISKLSAIFISHEKILTFLNSMAENKK